MNNAKLVSVCDYYIAYVIVCQQFFELFLKYFGRACRNRTYTACFEDKNDIHFTKARYYIYGAANWIRTNIGHFRRVLPIP